MAPYMVIMIIWDIIWDNDYIIVSHNDNIIMI